MRKTRNLFPDESTFVVCIRAGSKVVVSRMVIFLGDRGKIWGKPCCLQLAVLGRVLLPRWNKWNPLAQARHRPRDPGAGRGCLPWVEHTTSQCGARWGATRREGQPRNFSFHVLYPTTRSSTRIAMSMTMGGSARALALLVWLAAIPIAAHAAAEVSQVSGLRGWQPARTAFTAKGGEVGAGRVTVSLPASARWRFGRLRVAASIATKPTSPHGATCRARVPRPHAVLPFGKPHHPALHAHTTTEREPWFAYELLQDANDEALGRCGQRSDAI